MPACSFDGRIVEALWKPCGNPGNPVEATYPTASTCPGMDGMDGKQGKQGKQGKLRASSGKQPPGRQAGPSESGMENRPSARTDNLTSSFGARLAGLPGVGDASGDPRNPEWQCPFWEFGHLGPHVLGLLRLVLGDRQKSLLGAARHRLPGQARGCIPGGLRSVPCPRG